MISSVPLSVALTVLFALSGGYSLLRWASLRAGVAGHHGDQVAELSHLLMSLGMIAMVWAYGGGTGDAVQLIAYLALSGYFLTRLVRGRTTGRPGCPAPGFHLLMSGSMVWMVAAMPLLMAGSVAGPSGGMQMDGMTMGGMTMGGADTGLDARPVTATPGWALALTWVFIAGLVLGAGFWLRRALPALSTTTAATSPPATSAAPTIAATSTAVASTVVTSTTVASTTVASHTAPANSLLAALTPRADA
ncbi:MAG TPA: DUF5134 domain-containing protein, partial [Pseudonocardia sp.]|nr:DUF5134 domain-containing protein [Pseudonocardia sp.]